MTNTTSKPVTLRQRFGAGIYDGLLIIAIWFFATLIVLPFIPEHRIPPGNFLYQLYLLSVCFLFYGWCWTHGGQTLGMTAWKMRLTTLNDQPVNWTQALIRFVYFIPVIASFGLILFTCFWDPKRFAFHDRLSKTKLLTIAKGA